MYFILQEGDSLKEQVDAGVDDTHSEDSISVIGSEDQAENSVTVRSTKRPLETRSQRASSSKIRKKHEEEDMLLQKAIQCMEKSGNTKQMMGKRDPDEIFGEYVATELQSIKNEEMKRVIKFKIQSLLFSALTPQPNPSFPQAHDVRQWIPQQDSLYSSTPTDNWNYPVNYTSTLTDKWGQPPNCQQSSDFGSSLMEEHDKRKHLTCCLS